MSKKAVVTGQLNLVDESTGTNILSYNLANLFQTLTGVLEFSNVERQISSGDGTVTIDKGGVSAIRGFYLAITNGTGPVTLKHDSNTNGIDISSSLLLFGTLDTITIETESAQPVTVEYLLFE